MSLSSVSREFQSLGALIVKAILPLVTKWDLGGNKVGLCQQISVDRGTHTKSLMYFGMRPLEALKDQWVEIRTIYCQTMNINLGLRGILILSRQLVYNQ